MVLNGFFKISDKDQRNSRLLMNLFSCVEHLRQFNWAFTERFVNQIASDDLHVSFGFTLFKEIMHFFILMTLLKFECN